MASFSLSASTARAFSPTAGRRSSAGRRAARGPVRCVAAATVEKDSVSVVLLAGGVGKRMKAVAAAVNALDAEGIAELEREGCVSVNPDDGQGEALVEVSEVAILTDDIPGWLVSSVGGVTVALDISLDDALKGEGLARELVNRIQNLRKDAGLEVTDRIALTVDAAPEVEAAMKDNLDYIADETLANEVRWEAISGAERIELSEGINVALAVTKQD